jgi:regulator of cell morphogenesis and NO signaling
MTIQDSSINFSDKTVAQFVTEDYRTAEVFRKFGIDFCCGGKQSLSNACENKSIDIKKVQEELNNVEMSTSVEPQKKYNQWELDFLADYIVNVHHSYVRENIPLLLEFSEKVARVHGENHPEAIEIASLFAEVAAELQQHMMKEERMLFPYIKQLQNTAKSGKTLNKPPFGTAENPIRAMEAEHEHAGNLLKQIRLLSNNFTLPADACNTYRVTYSKLDEFEGDLHQHIHLENNILFPKAINLEQQL